MFPAEFHILGHTVQIDVIAPKDWPHGETCVGVWNPADNRIELVQQGEVQRQRFDAAMCR